MSATTSGGPSPRHRRSRSGPQDGPAPDRAPRPRGRSIRSRLLLILAVPTAALVIVALVAVADQLRTYREAEAAAASTRLALVAQGLVHELQRERGLSNGLLGGQQQYTAPLDQQRGRADRARAELDAALETAPPAAAPLRAALTTLAGKRDVRAAVDQRRIDQARSLEFYTAAIVALNDAGSADTGVIADAALRTGLDALRTLGDAKEATALERGFLNGVFSVDAFRGRDYARFTEIRGRRLAGLAAFSRDATPAQRAGLDQALRSPAAVTATELEQRALDGATAPRLGVAAPQWWDAMTVLVDDLRGVQQQVGTEVEARAAALRANALAALLLFVGLGLAALAVALALAVVAARSITRPLRVVASESARLPETVARIQATEGRSEPPASPAVEELRTRGDEIAEVAEAVTQVERTAVRLATEQAQLRRTTAESLANLARRNQNLLRRLLRFISDLERDEQDAETLANLFEIDHLATRMRRNAESLLVLVGERSPRQGTRPIPVGDVVRAALSEVEEYRRVALHRLEDALVVGAAGVDLAHLVAELLENALSFSPPDRDVEVHGQRVGPDYVLAVLDHGIGMSAGDLAVANGRLAGQEIFEVAPTRYLGHHVVGQLAARLDVRVRLHESPLTGITARITLPASLLVEPPAVAVAPADAPAGRVLPATGRPTPSARPPRAAAPVAVLERAPEAPAAPPAASLFMSHIPEPRTAESRTAESRASESGASESGTSESGASESWTAEPWISDPVSLFAPPAPAVPGPVGPERTRNGLVKRVRTAPDGAAPASRPVPGQPAPRTGSTPLPEPPPSRPAVDVRTTLNGFRAGFERRAQERGGPPDDDARVPTEDDGR